MKKLRRMADGALSNWEDDKAADLLSRGGFELAAETPVQAPVVAMPEPVAEVLSEEPKPEKKSKKGA